MDLSPIDDLEYWMTRLNESESELKKYSELFSAEHRALTYEETFALREEIQGLSARLHFIRVAIIDLKADQARPFWKKLFRK